MHSGLYVGWVRHRRLRPVLHQFRYPVFMVYLDLAELPALFRGRWFWSTRHPTWAWFRRGDYLGEPSQPLEVSVRALVAARTGHTPAGPIRVLTHLRYLGVLFSPLSLYYCFDASGQHVEAVVAEVSNTPWGERHCYVLMTSARDRDRATQRHAHRKEFHVSPFMPMDVVYRWRLSTPGQRLLVHIENHREAAKLFDATLLLSRRPLSRAELRRALLLFPAMTVKVLAAIYWEALRLWLKGCRFIPHPRTRAQQTENSA